MARFEDARLGVRLLGGFAVRVGGRTLDNDEWRLRRARMLVKMLMLAPERRLHRDQLTEALWPDRDPAGNALHQVIYTARRALSAPAGGVSGELSLTLRDDVVALAADGVWVDVDEFEDASLTARELQTPASYRAALDLYRGELLPEDRYEDWTTARREALRESHLGLLVELGRLLTESGELTGAVETLQRAVVEDPLHEEAHRALMELFARTGRRQQALAQYQQLRDALRHQLEAEPDPETARVYRELLAGQHEPQPQDPTITDAPTRAGSRLPHQLTGFVGRGRELAELATAARRARLLTLTGPGGAGKTRLALELAQRLEHEFADGVYLVELAPVADPALVVEETAKALAVQLSPEHPPIAVLARQIAERPLLLVLDNCEHLLDAAVAVADGLLRACPNLRVLATSRERLRVPGEVAWRIPPLTLPHADAVPDIAAFARFEAVSLFCQRAAEAAPGFVLDERNAGAVGDICRRLDGMPLALELAAARVGALSPAQIAERLGDALALLQGGSRAGLTRQQTLRATLTWSHDLLAARERMLYRRLGVFSGSFGLEAVEGICADGALLASQALDLLVALVEKSLVQVETGYGGHARYRLLETIRQDARERANSAGERERLEHAHRSWYAALAESANHDDDLTGVADWPPERLDPEYDDLRTALASAIRHDPVAGLRLGRSLWWFWMARGFFTEGARWLESALAAAPEPTIERARALVALGAIDVRRPVLRSASLGAQALEIARTRGDPGAEARALERFGVLSMGGYQWAAADRAFADGLALARRRGESAVAVAITSAQGVLAANRGETDAARRSLNRCLDLLAEIPDENTPLFWAMHVSPAVIPTGPAGAPRYIFEDTFCLFEAVGRTLGRGYTLVNIAETWRTDGDCDAARTQLEGALGLFTELGDRRGRGVALNALGNLARQAGRSDAGREHFEQALALRRAAGDPREIATTLTGMALLARAGGEESEARRRIDEANAIYERLEDGPGLTMIPMNLGVIELDHGDPARASDLFERSAVRLRRRNSDHNLGWALVMFAEAAIACGPSPRADAALAEARTMLERSGDARALRRVEAVSPT